MVRRRRVRRPARSFTTDPLRWRSHLSGFNRLLEEVYQVEIRLSLLLENRGIPPAQIERWREDRTWLSGFLVRLEEKLRDRLQTALPEGNPQVISYLYGLRGTGPLSKKEAAVHLGMTCAGIEEQHRLFLDYLRSEAGRIMLAEVVDFAARTGPT